MAISVPADLRLALTDKKCGIFVGAGVSKGAGLPDWSGMLAELIEHVRTSYRSQKQLVADLRALLKDKQKQLTLASVLKDELGADFSTYVEKRFTNPILNPTEAHKAIVALPAQFIVTTNYDKLLERAFLEKTAGREMPTTYTYKQAGAVASALYRDKYFILKAHGDAQEDPDGIILTEKDYRRVIHHEPGYQSLLQTLFTTFTILFVGTSFTDIELQLLLGFIHSSFHGKTPRHFALIADGKPNAALAKAWRKDFNIHMLHVSPKENYQEVLDFLSALKSSAP